MNKCLLGALLLAATAQSVSATGQLPRPAPRPTVAPAPLPTPQSPGAVERGNVTVTGCLYREDQFTSYKPDPGRAPAVDTFVLADAQVQDASPQATGTSGRPATGSASTYKIEKVPAERLRTLVGKRVEVVGRIDPEPVAPGRMSEFEAAQIREVTGTCPATPTA